VKTNSGYFFFGAALVAFFAGAFLAGMFYITPFPLDVEKDLREIKKAQGLVGPSNILCWLRLRCGGFSGCGGFSESSILYMKLFSGKIYQDFFRLSRPLSDFVGKGGKWGAGLLSPIMALS
jgi:hypothetical protein